MPKFTLPDSILKRDIKKEEKEFQHIGIIGGNTEHHARVHALIIAEVVHRLNFGLPACGINPETLKLENIKNPNSISSSELLKPIKKQKKNKKSGPKS